MFWRKRKKDVPTVSKTPPDGEPPKPQTGLAKSLLSLEPRLMFDAAAAATAAEVHQEQVAQEQAESAVSSDNASESEGQESSDSQELLQAIASYSPGGAPTEVAFVDPTVPDYQSLMAGMGPNVEILQLDGEQDGMAQIAAALNGRTGIDAIHIISHGSEGRLSLGTCMLTQESMTGQYASELAAIRQSLSESADILIYGCDFAEGQTGQDAATLLSQLTGADVAASTDDTGSAGLGGDWDLELQTGTIETQVAIDYDTQADWVGLLSLTTSGSETRVNTTSPGTQTHNSLNSYDNVDSVAMDGSGNYVNVWDNAGNIYGQRYNSAGVAQGSEFVIASNAANERMASVAMNSNGEFVVTWERDQGSGLYDIYARQYGSSGTAVGSEFLVNETTTYDQERARVAIDSSGNFVVVWESEHDSGGTYEDNLYAQRYDSSGTKLGTNFLVNSTTAGDQQAADIAMNDNGFMIVWEGETSAGSNSFDVYAKRYDASGVAQGTEFLVNTVTSGQEQYATVATSSNGSFVVAWSRWDGSDSNIYAQRLSSTGVAQGGEIAVTTSTSYNQYTPNVAMDTNGSFVVTWTSYGQDASSTYGVYARQYDASGSALTSETLANTTTSGHQDYSGVAYQSGKVVVSWSGNGTGDGSGIFTQRYDATAPNSAPVLADTTLSLTVSEDAGAPSGAVGSLISAFTGGVTDVDSGSAKGIAITGTNETNGTWYYTTNGGTTWTAVGPVSETSALLLADNGNTRLYFSPSADYNGTISNAITLRAWDQTSGSNGDRVSLPTSNNTVLDSMSSASFSSNNGTSNWSGSWIENDASGSGASTGSIDITSGFLRFRPTTVGNSLAREVDLSNATSATFSFSIPAIFMTTGQVLVQVSNNGGASYTTLETITSASATGTHSYDISSHMSSNTRIRFYGSVADSSGFRIDDVQVQYNALGGGNSAYSMVSDTASIVVTAVNDAPTIASLSGDSLSYSEGNGAVVIEQGGNALVADVDSTNFDTGTLTVSFTAGSDSAEDVLSIRNQGTGAGQIGVSGSSITYGGTTIGTFTGGSSGSNLVISLNSNATPAAVTALVKNITYQNTDTNAPATGARTVRFVLTDGDSGTSANYDTTVTVSGINDTPTDLSLSANTVAENAANGTTVGTVSGTDPDAGDTKTYSFTDSAGGRFAINSSTGVITVANSSLLNYETATSHSVTVRVTDNGGLTYDETFTINVTNVNEAPTGANATVTINEDASHALTTANFGFSDVDAGDSLSAVRIDSLPGAGTLRLSGVNVTAGQVIAVSDITAGNLVFTPAANANGTGYASFTFSVRDSSSVYDQAPNTLTFNVTAVNDAPVLDHSGTMTFNSITEDATSNSGQTVASIISSAGGDRITDADSGALEGIAITSLNSGSGTWQYNTGSGWTNVGTVSESSALLLRATDSLRFVPDGEGADSGSLSFRAWDQTSGTAGTKVATGTSTTILDQFNSTSFSNNNGSQNWSGAWIETDAGGAGPSAGSIQISSNQLRFDADTVGDNIAREVNLSNSTGATLSFSYNNTLAGADRIEVRVSSDGGANYTTLTNGVFSGSLLTGSGSASFDVSAYASANTRIQFIVTGTGGNDRFYVDNVQISSSGISATGAFSSATETASITVSAANDAPADLALSANTIAENAANGTMVGTVTGTDPDAGDTKTYSFTDSAGGRFAINSNTGVITVANSGLLNYENATSHSVTVRVTDSGGLTYDKTFIINLTNVNETPMDLSLSANTVAENAANGTTVGTVSGTDPDAGDTKTYSFTDSAGGRFAINSSTGVITVANSSLLNYEAATSHTVTVRVTDMGGLTYDETFTINLTNVNETPTDLALSSNTVAENAANGTVVGTVSGTDPDSGDSKTYSFTDSAGGRFAINSSTGEITVANGSLLNYELATDHSVTVRVTDAGGLTYDETFTINLTNVNEAPTGADATITINEDTAHTLTTANFGFSDVDAGDSLSAVRIDTLPSAGSLTLSGVAVAPNQVVTVADIAAGNLVFTPAVNANGTGYATFTFSVRDSNNTYDTAPSTLTFNVTAVNDAPINTVPGAQTVAVDTPLAISGLSVSDVDGNLTTVQLSVTNGTVAVTLSGGATISSGANGTATLTLTGTQANINTTLGSLTYQGNSLFTGTDTLTMLSTDGNGATDTDTVTISVSNNAPTNVLPAPQTVAEDTPLAISGLSVTDADGNLSSVQLSVTNGALSLTLSGGTTISAGSNGSGMVTLSGTQADLNATLASLTYQGNSNFAGSDTLTITSTDSTGTADTDNLSITVTAVNDTPTDLNLSANIVAENAANGTVIGTVTGTDPDSGDTGTYSFTNSAGGRFAINSSTGEITVANGSLLNYEAATSHTVTVRVTDSGGLTYDETFTINLTNIDEAPTNINLSANTVAENSTNGTVMGTASTTDPDAGDTHTYSLLDSAGGRFTINTNSGQITVADGTLLNYESAASHTITVRTTDAGGLTYDQTFTINLTNVNETPTDLALPSNTVAENAANGTVVGTVSGTDPDSGDTKTYSFTDNASGRFAINSSSGEITIANSSLLNYENATSHSVTVRVTDSGGLTYDETFTINVTNVNEAPSNINLSGNTVTENAATGTVVGTASTTDPDAGDTHTYQLTDTAGGRFAINSSTGVITVADGSLLNYEAAASHTITVRTTDAGGLTRDHTFTINLTNVNEMPTDLSLSANTVAENAANGTVVGTVSGTDPDSGDTKTYSFTDNASGRFAINSSSGEITIANSSLLNYENATSHSVTVRVTDSGGLTYDETFTINVTNVNETPSGVDTTITINEDTSHTLTIANFGFSDVDAGDSLSAVRIDTLPSAGSLTLSGVAVTAGQVVSVADITASNLIFTPVANANGTGYTSFTFSVRDSNNTYDAAPNTLTVDITASNDAPVITPIAPDVTFVEGGLPQVFDATGTIVDVDSANFDGGTLTVSISANGTADDRLQVGNFGTGPGQVGLSGNNVTYGGTMVGAVSGGTSGSDPLVVTFNTNATPSAVQEVYRSIQFNNVSDNPSTATRTLTIGLTDGDGGTATPQTKLVYVQASNDAPTDLALSSNTVAENAANGTVIGTITSTDPDTGDTSSYSFIDNAGGRFAIDTSTGQITVADGLLLNYESATSHSVTVRVTDSGGLTYDETFTINLTNVNEAPTGADTTVTISEDTSHTLTTANFGFGDVDAGDSLSAIRIDSLPGAGTLRLSGMNVTAGQVIAVSDITAGNLVFTPAADANGTGYASFTFSVRDSNTAYDAAPNTLTVNVTPVNDAPAITANTGSTTLEGGTDPITGAELAATDVDHGAAQLTYSIGTGPAHGRLELTTAPGVSATTFTQADIAANRVVYLHDGSETTSDQFTFTVSDGAGGSVGSTTVTLIVTPVNDAPTIVSGGGGATASYSVAENVTGITLVSGADVDLPAQALTYSINGGIDQALFSIDSSTGALSFTAPRDFEVATDANSDNVYVVQVRVTDSQGAVSAQTIQVTVTDVTEGITAPPSTPLLPPSLVPTTPAGPTAPVPPPTGEPVLPPAAPVPNESVAPRLESTFLPANLAQPQPLAAADRTMFIKSDDTKRLEAQGKDQPLPRWDDHHEPPLFTIVPVEPAPTLDPEPPDQPPSVSEILMAKLDDMTASLEEAVGIDQTQHTIVARIATLSGTVLSAGFVAWALRSSALLASALATMPAWKHFDPLPVVKLNRRDRNRRRADAEADQRHEASEFGGLQQLFDENPPSSSNRN